MIRPIKLPLPIQWKPIGLGQHVVEWLLRDKETWSEYWDRKSKESENIQGGTFKKE